MLKSSEFLLPHYYTRYRQRGKKYVIADPGVGIRYLSKTELAQGWVNGIMLLLEPDGVRFFAQPNDSDKPSGFVRFFKRVLPYHTLLSPSAILPTPTNLLVNFPTNIKPF